MNPDELLRQLGELATALAPAVRPAETDERGFEKRGWIEVHGRSVTVKQAAALRRFAGN
jgi:hypothetical protein